MSAAWPLVGRIDEMARVRALLAVEEGHGLLLVGPAGVGKTRIGRESVELAEQAGFATIRVAGSRAAAGLPLAAFAVDLPVGFADGDPADVLQRAQHALVEGAAGRPLFAHVDDAHLLDPASAALVAQLVVTRAAVVVCTVRAGEPVHDAITLLWKDEHLDRVDLEPLDAEEVHELLTVVLGGHLETALARELSKRSQGNVLYLRELLFQGLESGAIVDTGGAIRLDGLLGAGQRLLELVGTRLQGLDPEEHRTLELVALGEPLPTKVLDPRSLEALTRLEGRGLVRLDPAHGRVEAWLGHPLYGDVVRVRLSALDVQARTSELADATVAAGDTTVDDDLRVVVWRLDSGGAAPGPAVVAAASRAFALGDGALTLRLAEAAEAALGGFEPTALIGQAQALLGHCTEAEQTWAALASRELTDDQRSRLMMHRFFNLVGPLGGADEAMEMVAREQALLVTEEARAAASAPLIAILVSEGRFDTVRTHYPEVAGSLTGLPLFLASLGMVMAHLWGGQTNAALEMLDGPSLHDTDLSGAPLSFAFIADQARADALLHHGRIADAEAMARSVYERAVAAGDPRSQVWVATVVAKCHLAAGRPASAARWARVAGDAARTHGYANSMSDDRLQLAQAQALLGDVEGCRRSVERASADRTSSALYLRSLRSAEAWSAVAEGRIDAARTILAALAAEAGSHGDWVPESVALHDIARLGGAAGVVDRLAELALLVDGDLSSARAAHAAALASAAPEDLDAVSERFAEIGAILLAAEASADAAAAWKVRGDSRRSAGASRRSTELADRCEGAQTPALGSIAARVDLTPSERRVATLAAAGRSNKEIAAELILSVRTVENTLSRAYRTLGVTSRAELPAALGG